MEATLEIFAEKISSALNNTDDTELQLKMQAAQHEHELTKCSQCSHSFLQDQIPHFHLSTRHQSSPHSTTQDNCHLSIPFTTLLSP